VPTHILKFLNLKVFPVWPVKPQREKWENSLGRWPYAYHVQTYNLWACSIMAERVFCPRKSQNSLTRHSSPHPIKRYILFCKMWPSWDLYSPAGPSSYLGNQIPLYSAHSMTHQWMENFPVEKGNASSKRPPLYQSWILTLEVSVRKLRAHEKTTQKIFRYCTDIFRNVFPTMKQTEGVASDLGQQSHWYCSVHLIHLSLLLLPYYHHMTAPL
jgi:hypothetical protein